MEMSPNAVVALLLENLAVAYMLLAVIVGIAGFVVGKLKNSKLSIGAEIEQLHLCAASLFVIQAISMLVIKVTLFGM